MFMHILNNLPGEYKVVQHDLEKRLKNSTNPLTTQDIQTELKLKYTRMYLKKSKDEEMNGKIGLFAGGFKGRCHNCGKRGYKAIYCPDKKNKENQETYNTSHAQGYKQRFRNKCSYCSKVGHREAKLRSPLLWIRNVLNLSS